MKTILQNKKLITVFSLLFYLFAFGVAAYYVSYEKGEISKYTFTISQSLAFGNDPALVTLFTLGTLSYIYLLILRGPAKLLYIRIFLQIVIYTFLITIIWITTYKDKEKHYIFATIIFLCTLIYHILTYIVFRNEKISTLAKYTLLISSILNGLVFIGLGITRIPALQKYIEAKITFASLENSVVLIILLDKLYH